VSVGTEPARLSDLFASAVHRYGAVWPDLLVVSVIGTILAGLPAVVLHHNGRPASTVYVAAALAYGVAYYAFLGFVVLRGLPQPAPVGRLVATYGCGAAIGLVTGVLLLFLEPFVVLVVPLFMLAVPAVAAGDESVWGAPWRAVALSFGNFQRTWAVWLVTMVFSAPVIISMFLIVSAFSSGIVAQLLSLGCSVPIVWPFSALFIRALYGDLTGRRVLAAEDRS
jgi:hypothetical protein